ncbi:DUF11 domain-containing protein [Tahibacter amnicola]|uniref:DUF11 domain-containing protein n=1 Tax=Tahibacter amnicola TaxID=2976241 RepID=A0ABY6BC18_9GAMM|nr:DUF11 domain-containing protein [Tahibacter amnicola]UXI67409.1 DUF11 domain-containing protein [Tahibacter amnicola]
MKRKAITLGMALLYSSAQGTEVTVKNDSLTDNTNAVVVSGFVAGEAAASWLTAPCAGDIRAIQMYWRSASGGSGTTIGNAIEILRGGTFPVPGSVAATIGGPVLTDSVMNEYRYLDENNTIPLSVPVSQGENFVVAFSFLETPPAPGPSVVRDTDGILSGRNALLASVGGSFIWFDSAALGLSGDWVIRAVLDCPVVAQNADVSVTMSASAPGYTAGASLSYTVVVANAGPSAAGNTSVVDIFPGAFGSIAWTCTASGGASCTSGGTGNITQVVSLPAGSQLTYAINGNVLATTTGVLSNSATAVVGGPAADPNSANNTATLELLPFSDVIFQSGFESPSQ